MVAEPDDEAALATHAGVLVAAVDRALGGWVAAVLNARAPHLAGSAPAVADEVRALVVPVLRDLLTTDIDRQSQTPLEVLRGATWPVTAVLAEAGVDPPRRDDVGRRMFPDDIYDLGPASFADLGEEVATAGLTWGAAKAHVHLARRRAIEDRAAER